MQNVSLSPSLPKLRKSDGPNGAGKHSQVLAPVLAKPYAVIEVIAGMALACACGFILRPDDPLLLQLEFPWLWLVATLFALRYGAILGVLAGLCLALAWFVLYENQAGSQLPVMLFVGGMVQLVVTGHFCDVWSARNRRLKAVNAYLDERLVALTNHHYLLKVSHERLERDSLTKPFTLRDAFEHMRTLSQQQGEGVLPHADAMLSFAANGCQISQAAVFALKEAGGVDPQAVATVGRPFELELGDVMLKESLRQMRLVHVRQTGGAESDYLMCAPITAASGYVLGVLVVRKMAFLSLNDDTLRLLLVLLSYYADGIEQHSLLKPLQGSMPGCPDDFALELARLAHLHRRCGVRSSMLGMVFTEGALTDALIEPLICAHRALDLVWTYEREGVRILIVMLPLTDDLGVDGYLARVEQAARKQFKHELAEAMLATYQMPVDSTQPGYGLKQLVSRCNRHG